MHKEFLNFLGLANRAGALITGTELVLAGVRRQKVKLVIVDANVSAGTLKKIRDKCKFYDVDMVQGLGSISIGSAIGSENRKVIGVVDGNFAKGLKDKLK